MILWLLLTSVTIQPDKAAHFGISSALNMACIQTMKKATDNKAASIISCSAVTLLAGGIKELADPALGGNGEWGDFIADGLGVSFSAVFLSF